MRLAACTFGRATACADGFRHSHCDGDQRARAARARELPRLRAFQASGGLRLLLGAVAAQRDGDRTEWREIGAVEAAMDDFALALRQQIGARRGLVQTPIVSIS